MQSLNLESGKKLEAAVKNIIEVRTVRCFKTKITKEIKPEKPISQSVRVKRHQSESNLDRLSNAELQTLSLTHLYKLSRLLPLSVQIKK